MADKINSYFQKAATQAFNELKRSTEEFRPDVDSSVHVLNLSRDVIREQLLQRAIGQRGRSYSYNFSSEDVAIAEELTTTFINAVKKAATDTQTFLCVDLQGNNLTYTPSSNTLVQDGIVIVAKVKGVVAFNKAKSLIIAGEKSIVSDFNSKLSKRRKEVYKIFDTGHLSGRSVAEEMQMAAAEKFASPSTKKAGPSLFRPSVSILQDIDFGKADGFYTLVQKTRETRLRDRSFLLELQRSVNPELKKYIKIGANTVVMAVEPQSWEYNNFMAAIEKADKAATASLMENLKDLGPEYWAKKPGSPSSLENIINLLIKEATKIDPTKGKRTKRRVDIKSLRNPQEPAASKSKNPKKITGQGKKLRPTVSDASNLNLPTQTSSTPRRNWLSLLPIINQRLTPKVIANMRFPSLVNRTGTFANSAKVVNVEQTREGFPTFVFDYERNPYDVFDRSVGRSPWNTPERDPRALVDKSVREIVREMAIGRFYTRRA